jgi:hypothetical protein
VEQNEGWRKRAAEHLGWSAGGEKDGQMDREKRLLCLASPAVLFTPLSFSLLLLLLLSSSSFPVLLLSQRESVSQKGPQLENRKPTQVVASTDHLPIFHQVSVGVLLLRNISFWWPPAATAATLPSITLLCVAV